MCFYFPVKLLVTTTSVPETSLVEDARIPGSVRRCTSFYRTACCVLSSVFQSSQWWSYWLGAPEVFDEWSIPLADGLEPRGDGMMRGIRRPPHAAMNFGQTPVTLTLLTLHPPRTLCSCLAHER